MQPPKGPYHAYAVRISEVRLVNDPLIAVVPAGHVDTVGVDIGNKAFSLRARKVRDLSDRLLGGDRIHKCPQNIPAVPAGGPFHVNQKAPPPTRAVPPSSCVRREPSTDSRKRSYACRVRRLKTCRRLTDDPTQIIAAPTPRIVAKLTIHGSLDSVAQRHRRRSSEVPPPLEGSTRAPEGYSADSTVFAFRRFGCAIRQVKWRGLALRKSSLSLGSADSASTPVAPPALMRNSVCIYCEGRLRVTF